MRVKRLPEYGEKYLLREDGRLYRKDRWEEWRVVRPSGNPPRVRLYDGETERRVYVHSLLEELYPGEGLGEKVLEKSTPPGPGSPGVGGGGVPPSTSSGKYRRKRKRGSAKKKNSDTKD